MLSTVVFRVIVSQPEEGIEPRVKLVIVMIVRIDLVQVITQLLTKADDCRSMRTVRQFPSGRSRIVLDVEGELLLAPLGQKSRHQIVEPLRVVHAYTRFRFILLVIMIIITVLLGVF